MSDLVGVVATLAFIAADFYFIGKYPLKGKKK